MSKILKKLGFSEVCDRLAEKKKEAAVLNDASPAKHKVSERAM